MSGSTCVVSGAVPGTAWTHSQVICAVPPGQGAARLVVLYTSDARASNAVSFSYNAPVVSSISPTSANTGAPFVAAAHAGARS